MSRWSGCCTTAAPAGAHRDREIQPWVGNFEEFRRGFNEQAFRASVQEVLAGTQLASCAAFRPEGGRPYPLTESRMKLMFYYKNRFGQLRDASHIVLRGL